MNERIDLKSLEREAYRASWSDGIVDLYLGISGIWIGATWIWLHDLAGIAGVLPAIFLAPVLSVHRRFVEARLGYVNWRAPRRSWERRNLRVLFGAGVGLLLLGVVTFLFVSANDGIGTLRLGPGILAWLLALFAVGLALLLDARRMLLYAAVLATSGVVVVVLEAMPGWPMLLTGVVAVAVGAVMLWRFVHRYPVIERPHA